MPFTSTRTEADIGWHSCSPGRSGRKAVGVSGRNDGMLSSQGSLAVEKQAVGLDASCVQTAAHTLEQISSCLLSALLGY